MTAKSENDHFDLDYIIPASVFSVVFFLVSLFWIPEGAKDLYKIKTAPRVYIVDHLKGK